VSGFHIIDYSGIFSSLIAHSDKISGQPNNPNTMLTNDTPQSHKINTTSLRTYEETVFSNIYSVTNDNAIKWYNLNKV
jgi:hypothetical protein